MLLEIAMADAYGAGFEFAEHEYIKQNHCLRKYHQSPYDKKPAGRYTDDTQMTIALCELMINEPGTWNKELVAKYFLKAFKRDPRDTYSNDFYHFLKETDCSGLILPDTSKDFS
ncbi:ADP-ribosylglycohydrolase family protein [Psychromonas sp. KJ10-10]|uniref:ADP-ribosylglycohydrolase family protein n=1 Tax=Psychromonas sp. KJ10-10 TaxID=3391823 RepID=UPI0039B412B4